MDNFTVLELHDLLEKLIPLYELTDTGSSYQTSLNALKSFALGVDAIGHTNIQEDASRKSSIIRHITICLNETLVQGCNQHAQALCILADVSRQGAWQENMNGICQLIPHSQMARSLRRLQVAIEPRRMAPDLSRTFSHIRA